MHVLPSGCGCVKFVIGGAEVEGITTENKIESKHL